MPSCGIDDHPPCPRDYPLLLEGFQSLFRGALGGSENPSIPADVVWYPHEPTWKLVAEGALRYGLRDFELTVRYDDDYGVDAGLKLAVERAGLDLGGSFQEHVSTSWKISGKFGSRS